MTKTVEIWICMDSDGDYAISDSDDQDAIENYGANFGSQTIRVVKVAVTMAPPEACIDGGEIAVPAEAGSVTTVAS